MDKRQLSEADIRTKYITPAIVGSPDAPKGNVLTQLREEVYLTASRVVVRGRTRLLLVMATGTGKT
jgi:type I restriction enzyme R subunit